MRVCADGRKQRKYITKEAAISTTIQMTSLILSLLIDAEKGRDIATADVVGVNLMTDMKDKVIVKLTGDAVDIMCEVNKNIFLSYQEKKEESNLRKTKKGIIWVYVVCNSMVQYF